MTHTRRGLACTAVLVWAVCCLLPAAASAHAISLSRVMVHADSDYAVNDPYFPFQWALDNNANDADIDVNQAWKRSEGEGVDVAVIDQRIETHNVDLAANIAPGDWKDFVADDTDTPGCSAAAPSGDQDHGTAVAGEIAAVHDNFFGIAGVAPEAHVIPVRALDNCGQAPLPRILEAFRYAAENAPIVSASFSTSPLLDDATKAKVNTDFWQLFQDYPDTLFVVAAGNEGADVDSSPVYPCATEYPWRMRPANLICVGMSDHSDRPVCWGNVGQRSVDLFAPGSGGPMGAGIWTATGTHGFSNRIEGTSIAAPMVAATAALVRAQQPDITLDDLRQALVGSVDTIAGMDTISVSQGRLNAARAVGVRPAGLGGAGGVWTSCDRDHDGWTDSGPKVVDQCPDDPAPDRADGCPDTDSDGIRDKDDNCPQLANVDQKDTDGDKIGDACDPTPNGDDRDGDKKFGAADRCPDEPAATPDGCPIVIQPPADNPGDDVTPVPTAAPTLAPPVETSPRVVSLAVKVTPRKCAHAHACKQAAKVTVKLSRKATVALKVEHRERKHGRWTWKRVTAKSVVATVSGKSLTVHGARGHTLAKGSYRVTATLAGATAARSFTV